MKSYRKRLVSLGVCSLLFFGLSTNSAHAAFSTINNDAWLKSTNGQPIYAHSGYVVKFGSTYYLYGQEYAGSSVYYQTGTSPTNVADFVSTNVYTSTDLINWTAKVVAWDGGTYVDRTAGDWAGRNWGVLYNAATSKYVMWMKYIGVNGTGALCLTATSPLGPFTVDHLQTSVVNIFSTPQIPGDSKFFYAADGTPYLACSDSHGRQRAYVAPLSADYKTINAAVEIAVWPEGQEGNTAFYVPATNQYYYFTSETNGWSYSWAFVVNSTSLSSGYTGRVILPGTQPSNTYWAQTLQAIGIHGTSGTVNMLLCDRWGLFSTNYASAGHGIGYNVWEPLTISGATVTFNPLSTWKLDAAAGTWQQTVPSGTAPTYVASGTASSGTGTIAPALPSGLLNGDILLLFVETANQAVSVSNQNGGTWAAVSTPGATGTAGGTDGARLTVFWSRYNGTQGAPTVSDSGDHQLASIIAIRGAAATGNPWNVATAGDVDTYTDTGAWILGGTTTVDNTLVVVASTGATPDADGNANFSAWTNGNLTSLTERVDITTSQGNGGALGIATGVKAFAGDCGVTTALLATAGKKGLISIAIKQ